MISHIIPYEKTYISVTLSIEEATSLLALLNETQQESLINETIINLRKVIDNSLTRAIHYQNKKDSK
jgi:predicted P-loop ATPase/GTPase